MWRSLLLHTHGAFFSQLLIARGLSFNFNTSIAGWRMDPLKMRFLLIRDFQPAILVYPDVRLMVVFSRRSLTQQTWKDEYVATCWTVCSLMYDIKNPSENNRMDQPTLQTQMQLLISYHNHQNGGVIVVFAFHLWQDLESIFRAPQCPPEVFLGAFCFRVNQNCSFNPLKNILVKQKVKMDRKLGLWLKVKFLQVNFIKFVLAEFPLTSFDRGQWFFCVFL